MLTYRQISPNIFLLANCPMKIKASQAQSNQIVFKQAPAYKIQVCVDLRTPDMNKVT